MGKIIGYAKVVSILVLALLYLLFVIKIIESLWELLFGQMNYLLVYLFILFIISIIVLVIASIGELILEKYTSYVRLSSLSTIKEIKRIKSKSIPLPVFLKQDIPNEWRDKITIVSEVKEYANSLGFAGQNIYDRFYDTKGKPCGFSLIGCKIDRFEPYLWRPPIGNPVADRLYYDKESTLKEERKLKNKGYEIYLTAILGYATRQKIKSPLFSVMLDYPLGTLIYVLFHEIVHETAGHCKNSTADETIATSMAEKLAVNFISAKFGEKSIQMEEVKTYLKNSDEFGTYIRKTYKELEMLYSSGKTRDAVLAEKKKILDKYSEFLKEISERRLKYFKQYTFQSIEINNAYIYNWYQYYKI